MYSMYVCMYACMRACMYVFMYVCVYVCVYSYNKTNEMQYFTNLFWHRILHVLDRFTVHHQESVTVHTAIGICHTEILKMGKITIVYSCTL
jgi:hypothetical protein